MAAERQAGIDADELQSRTLNDISAADFLSALTSDDALGMQVMRHWPEKKKIELLVEPENYGKLRVVDLLKGIREKKKVELEKHPRLEWDIPKNIGSEFEWQDPRDLLRDPVIIREIAREIAVQLRGMR